MFDLKLKTVCAQIPHLANATKITPITGGLTNINYRVDTPNNTYMMRVSDKSSALLGINRENEKINNEKAYQAGIAPAVKGFLPSENVLVIDWIEGRTLKVADFHAEPDLLPRIAETIKKLHQSAPFQGDFNFPDIRKQYLKIILENGYFMPEGVLEVEPLISELENKLAAEPEKWVSCHNDLVAANFIDDGEKIWLIDFEYASLHEPSLDIGNFAAEVGLNDTQLTAFCDIYWGEHLPSKIARARACSIITRSLWVLWSCIQDAVSPIEYGFKDWAILRWQTVLADLKTQLKD